MPVQLIHDGMTVEDILPETENHDELRFSYRPATESEYTRYTRTVEKLNEKPPGPVDKRDPISLLTAQFLSDHLISWDVETKENELAEVNTQNCLQLPAQVSVELLEKIVTTSRNGVMSEQLGN